jgi:hypothetical protein
VKKELYFVQAEITKRIKIGQSNCPERRLKAKQTDSPEKLALLGVLPCYDNTEALHHKDFQAYKVHGEWFEACPELLAYIATEAKSHQRCEECLCYDSQTDGRLIVLKRTPTHRHSG